jgi:two-component system, LytTR family, sensor kinase
VTQLHSADAVDDRDATADGLPVVWVVIACAAGATILALSIASQIYQSMPNHGHSFGRIVLWQFASWNVWALLAPIAFRAGRTLAGSLHDVRRHLVQLVALGAVIITVHRAAASLFAVWLQPFRPVETSTFSSAFYSSLPYLVTLNLLPYVSLLVAGSVVAVYRRARRLELRESRLEAALARAELDALRLEIRPHFLFNTLNSIAALIRSRDNNRALEMLIKLSDLMRTTLERPTGHLVSVAAEVAFAKRYLDLQLERFGDRLEVVYSLGADCQQLSMPILLLQPLVENALRHGIARRSGPARVEIGGRLEGGTLRLWVRDDGAGLPAGFDIATDAGTGLRNTRSRLKQIYGAAARLEIQPAAPSGVSVEVVMPAVRWVNELEASA